MAYIPIQECLTTGREIVKANQSNGNSLSSPQNEGAPISGFARIIWCVAERKAQRSMPQVGRSLRANWYCRIKGLRGFIPSYQHPQTPREGFGREEPEILAWRRRS